MNQITDQIDDMHRSPEKWIDVLEAIVDSMLTESESSQHSISQFTGDTLDYLTRTIQTNPEIASSDMKVHAHRESLALIQMPSLILDESGSIIERNDLLKHFFYQNNMTIRIDSDQLIFHNPEQQIKFQALVHRARTDPGMNRDTFQSDADESIAISIYHSCYADQHLYTIMFSINLLESIIALEMVMRSLALSRQESLLSLHLASGETMQQAAHAIGISYQTARGYLKSIYAKTDCNNQLMLAFKVHNACIPRLTDKAPVSEIDSPEPSPEMIMASFGLSGQEASLSLQLTSGIALKQAAHAIGVSYETARGYLKSIYAKTDCNNQIELALKIQNDSVPVTASQIPAVKGIVSPNVDATYRLKGGRILSYCIYGPEDGYPVVAHHTTCGSRKQIHHNTRMLYQHHLKIMIVDRPGYGASTYDKERTLHDWPPDLEQLLDHLGIRKFALLGIQYGAEYALVCSQYFGNRVSSTQLISMESPPELRCSDIPREFPHMQKSIRLNKRTHISSRILANKGAARILQQALKFLTKIYANNPQKLFKQVVAFNSVQDRQLLGDERFIQQSLHAWRVAYAQTEGMMLVKDVQILLKPWQIDFTAIKRPVHIWHSRDDPQALFSPVENLLQHFNHGIAELHVIEDDSVMTFYHCMEEVIAQVQSILDPESSSG